MSEVEKVYEEIANVVQKEVDTSATTTEETPSESQPEKEEEKEVSQEKPEEKQETPEEQPREKLPQFDKHPRWRRMLEENKELKQFRQQAEEKLHALEEWKVSQTQPKQEVIPQEFKTLYGEDPEVFRQWQSLNERQTADLVNRILSEREKQQYEQQSKAEKVKQEIVSWAENEFVDLTEETGIDFSDQKNNERNQILDICEEYGLVDADGRPNLRKANELRKILYKTDNVALEEKKNIAAKASSRSNAAPQEEEVMTSSRLKKKRIEDYFS